ncbi:MAG: hypothetical protein K0R80_426 [Clostridia bacterium]|nr:hypothetical protein [Clostridia bacterium]
MVLLYLFLKTKNKEVCIPNNADFFIYVHNHDLQIWREYVGIEPTREATNPVY